MGTDFQRLFFALWPEVPLRQRLARIQTRWTARARPVPAERLHMTLVFLGQVTPGQRDAAEQVAGQLVFPRCDLRLDRLGTFPGARVGWIGPSTVPAPLNDFAVEFRARLVRARVPCDVRAWKPHVTLYRNLRTPAPTMQFDAVDWQVDSFCLVRSRRSEGELRYEPITIW